MRKKQRRLKKAIKNIVILVTLCAVLVVLFFTAAVVIVNISSSPNEADIEPKVPFENVKKYEPMLRDELAKYDLEKYTPVLLALMQQESRGVGNDPMQASESSGLEPNAIKEPQESIRQGVKHFHSVLSYGKKKRVDFPTIIQAYNMGRGYIDYVVEHGGKHSEQLAKQFSLMQVHQHPERYNCGGDKDNFRYPYCYGDFTYSTKVEQNIKDLTQSVPVSAQQEKTDSSRPCQ